jgi:DNA-binding phage protein
VKIEDVIMAKKQKPPRSIAVEVTTDRTAREDALQERYGRRPSLRALYESGQIDRQAYERADRMRTEGPPNRPFHELIATLRAERERQGLSLTEIAERTGMDRAAIHKLEIGLNRNPTCATLARYAEALGARIEWNLVSG